MSPVPAPVPPASPSPSPLHPAPKSLLSIFLSFRQKDRNFHSQSDRLDGSSRLLTISPQPRTHEGPSPRAASRPQLGRHRSPTWGPPRKAQALLGPAMTNRPHQSTKIAWRGLGTSSRPAARREKQAQECALAMVPAESGPGAKWV